MRDGLGVAGAAGGHAWAGGQPSEARLACAHQHDLAGLASAFRCSVLERTGDPQPGVARLTFLLGSLAVWYFQT